MPIDTLFDQVQSRFIAYAECGRVDDALVLCTVASKDPEKLARAVEESETANPGVRVFKPWRGSIMHATWPYHPAKMLTTFKHL